MLNYTRSRSNALGGVGFSETHHKRYPSIKINQVFVLSHDGLIWAARTYTVTLQTISFIK